MPGGSGRNPRSPHKVHKADSATREAGPVSSKRSAISASDLVYGRGKGAAHHGTSARGELSFLRRGCHHVERRISSRDHRHDLWTPQAHLATLFGEPTALWSN